MTRRPGWRRSFTYRSDRLPVAEVPVRTPVSQDAPIDERDNRFWWFVAMAFVILTAVFVAVLFALS